MPLIQLSSRSMSRELASLLRGLLQMPVGVLPAATVTNDAVAVICRACSGWLPRTSAPSSLNSCCWRSHRHLVCALRRLCQRCRMRGGTAHNLHFAGHASTLAVLLHLYFSTASAAVVCGTGLQGLTSQCWCSTCPNLLVADALLRDS